MPNAMHSARPRAIQCSRGMSERDGRRVTATTQRKIYFYRTDVGCDPSGRPLPFDPTPALQQVQHLPYDINGRYLDDGELSLCCWVDCATASHRLRFAPQERR